MPTLLADLKWVPPGPADMTYIIERWDLGGDITDRGKISVFKCTDGSFAVWHPELKYAVMDLDAFDVQAMLFKYAP